MKHKWILNAGIALLAIVLAVGLLLACVDACIIGLLELSERKTEIKQGFSPELLICLQTRFGITIPEEAQFLEGYNMPGFQDPSVDILFELPISNMHETDDHMFNYLHRVLKLGHRYSGPERADSYRDDELGGQMEWELRDQTRYYTYISYRIEANKLVIRFQGWRPGTTFP
jgi:hypothetical protein